MTGYTEHDKTVAKSTVEFHGRVSVFASLTKEQRQVLKDNIGRIVNDMTAMQLSVLDATLGRIPVMGPTANGYAQDILGSVREELANKFREAFNGEEDNVTGKDQVASGR